MLLLTQPPARTTPTIPQAEPRTQPRAVGKACGAVGGSLQGRHPRGKSRRGSGALCTARTVPATLSHPSPSFGPRSPGTSLQPNCRNSRVVGPSGAGQTFPLPKTRPLTYWHPQIPTFDFRCSDPDHGLWPACLRAEVAPDGATPGQREKGKWKHG